MGIKHGCPLSPLLFNFALEGILSHLDPFGQGYQLSNGASVSSLAYADDLLISDSKEALQRQLDAVTQFTSWASLAFNINKCGCLSVMNNSPRGRYIEPFSPRMLDEAVSALKWEDSYGYLGVRISRTRGGQVDNLTNEVLSVIDKILVSNLTNWQKVDAINTFALSKLSYQLTAASLKSKLGNKILRNTSPKN